MNARKLSNITDVSKLEMHDFSIVKVDADEEILVLVGDRGYRYYYRVELKFFGLVYIACAPSFMDMGTFQFRLATPQEIAGIQEYMDNQQATVYCFEEDISRWTPPPKRKARKFFIAAGGVEITVYYGGDNLDDLLRGLDEPH